MKKLVKVLLLALYCPILSAQVELEWKFDVTIPQAKEKVDLRTLFGAWEDDKDSDESIKEIGESKIEKSENFGFE